MGGCRGGVLPEQARLARHQRAARLASSRGRKDDNYAAPLVCVRDTAVYNAFKTVMHVLCDVKREHEGAMTQGTGCRFASQRSVHVPNI